MAKPDPIDALLLEGINSGPGTSLATEHWKSIREEGLWIIADRKRVQARQAERYRSMSVARPLNIASWGYT